MDTEKHGFFFLLFLAGSKNLCDALLRGNAGFRPYRAQCFFSGS